MPLAVTTLDLGTVLLIIVIVIVIIALSRGRL